MAIVHLARHGTHAEVGGVLSGRSEIGLNDAGRREAAWLADRLAQAPIGEIRSSPRRRTMETAEIVAAGHGLRVIPCEALDEIDFGVWTGRAFAALEGDPAWRSWNEARGTARVPEGETMAEAIARAWPALAYEGPGELLCVTHCDVIRGLVSRLIGLPIDRMLGFDCDPASLTTVSLYGGSGRLVSLNERPR
jgi:broad specificity phosphatase PhoE